MFWRDGFTADGEIRLTGAHVARALTCAVAVWPSLITAIWQRYPYKASHYAKYLGRSIYTASRAAT